MGFFYYRADDYTDNSTAGVPYGSGAEEYGVTATLARRITRTPSRVVEVWLLPLQRRVLYGGNRDFCSHLVYSSLQYRF